MSVFTVIFTLQKLMDCQSFCIFKIKNLSGFYNFTIKKTGLNYTNNAMNIFGKYRWSGIVKKIILFSWPFFLAVLVFLSTKFAIRNSGLVEHYFSTGIYPFIAKLFSSFSKLYPFSLWDIFWVLIICIGN